MTYEMEQRLRNEARALKNSGVAGWDRNLRAAGFDPDKWSDGTPAHIGWDPDQTRREIEQRCGSGQSPVHRAIADERPQLQSFDPANPQAWTDEPRTRAAPKANVVRYGGADLDAMTREQVHALPNFRHRAMAGGGAIDDRKEPKK